jgi:hypothetical protein
MGGLRADTRYTKHNGEGKSPSPGSGDQEVADLLGRTSISGSSSSTARRAPAYIASDFAKWEFAITAYIKLRGWWKGITTQVTCMGDLIPKAGSLRCPLQLN